MVVRIGIFYLLVGITSSAFIVIGLNPIHNQSGLLFNHKLLEKWSKIRSIWTFEKGIELSNNLTFKECDAIIKKPSNYASCTIPDFKVHLIKFGNDHYLDFISSSKNLLLHFHTIAFHSFVKSSFDENNKYFIFR